MSNYNHVVLMGHLTKEVELRYTPRGIAIANIDIAINRVWKNEQGEKQEEVSFFNCVAFGRTAEVAGQYCKKGHLLHLDGRLKQETWDDKQTGQKRYAVKVIVETIQLLGDGGGKRESTPRAAQPGAATSGYQAPAEEEQDVPF